MDCPQKVQRITNTAKMFSLNLNTVEESDKLRIWEIFQGMGPGHLKIIIINDNNKNGSEFA
jgi:hypothetical protein